MPKSEDKNERLVRFSTIQLELFLKKDRKEGLPARADSKIYVRSVP
jgi:hypothetical protein